MDAAYQLVDPAPVSEARLSSWRSRLRALRRAGAVLSILVIALAGAVVLFGGISNVGGIGDIGPDQPGMAMSTALGLIACGAYAFRMAVAPGAQGAPLRTPVAWALLAIAAANFVLFEVFGRGLDALLSAMAGGSSDAHMSPATSVALALAAGCLLVSRRRGGLVDGDAYGLMAAAGISIAVLALTGYAFDSGALHDVFIFSAMSIHTAIGFLALFLALLLARPTWGLMRVVVGPGPGSVALRRLLPYFVLGPFGFCWLTLIAVRADVIDSNFRLSVLAIAGAAFLTLLLFRGAVRQNAEAKDRAAAHRRLMAALKDREVLLKEVYHRVKNNLQFVDAMLALEAGAEDNRALAEPLARIRARVHALALVHQQLIGARDLATLNLHDFLHDLCAHQAEGAGLEAREIEIETRIDPIWIDLDRAVPIGLMVAELLSNSAKHAFPDRRPGTISVVAGRNDKGELVVSVSDNGVGAGAGGENASRHGGMILRALTAQLGARMTVEDRDGYRVGLTIPNSGHERID